MGARDSVRSWLIEHRWFISFADAGPWGWTIRAVSPQGRLCQFHQSREDIEKNAVAVSDWGVGP